MALNTLMCDHLTWLGLKGLRRHLYWCIETVKSLTEAIKRLEANARDSALDDPTSRSLQHSVSCGTIIVDPRSAAPDAAAAANGRLFLALQRGRIETNGTASCRDNILTRNNAAMKLGRTAPKRIITRLC